MVQNQYLSISPAVRPVLGSGGVGGLPGELEYRRKGKPARLQEPHLPRLLPLVDRRFTEAALPQRAQCLSVIGFRFDQGPLNVGTGDAFGFQCFRRSEERRVGIECRWPTASTP